MGAALIAGVLTACVAAAPATDDGVAVIDWWIAPSHGDLTGVIGACNDEHDGAFRLELHELPADPVERRTTLIRRLLADDPDIDLISVDSELTPELAQSDLLQPVPQSRADTVRDTAYPEATATTEHEGDLYAVPFLWEPHLLWYRPSVAQRAGLDMSETLAWSNLLAAAERAQASVVMDDPDGRMVLAWITAAIAGAGGTVLSGPDPRATVGLDGPGGREAAALLKAYRDSPAGGEPEADVAERFASVNGGFALAGPSFIAHPDVQTVVTDLAWAPFPVLIATEDEEEASGTAPVSGINLAVARGARLPEAAGLAIDCLTAPRMAEPLVAETGHALAYPQVLNETLEDAYPLTEIVTASLETGAPATVSPWWAAIDEAVAHTWTPLAEIDDSTAAQAQRRAIALLRGEDL